MKSCNNCKYTEYQCSILKHIKQQDRNFYVGNEFVSRKDFYCSRWTK